MDQRDALTWIAVELTHQGEAKVEDGSLEEALRKDLHAPEDHPVFVPAEIYRKGTEIVVLTVLMDEYAFVASGLPETSYYALEDRPYVASVVSVRTGPHKIRTLSTIPNSKIEEWRSQLRAKVSADIRAADRVRVREGKYKTLVGDVTGIEQDSAFVRIHLRSLKIIADIPLVFLEVYDEPEDVAGENGNL